MSAVFTILLNVIAPVFLVIGVGFAIGKRFAVDVGSVNRIAMYGAVPALVFRALSTLELEGAGVGRLLAALAVHLSALALLAATLGRGWGAQRRRSFTATAMLSNAANINLPVALFAFGEAGLERALVLYVAMTLVIFTLGSALLGRARSARATAAMLLAFPVFWASAAGLAARAAGFVAPSALARAIDLLADAAVPVVLLALGVQLARARIALPRGGTWLAVGVKLLAAPAIAFAAGRALGVTGLDLAVLVTLGAMPTPINAANLALELGGEVDFVTEVVVTGTLLALITLPLVLAWTGGWVP